MALTARSQVLHPDLPDEWQGLKYLDYHLLPSQVHLQEVELEVEQPVLKPAFQYGVPGRSLTYRTTILAPSVSFIVLIELTLTLSVSLSVLFLVFLGVPLSGVPQFF